MAALRCGDDRAFEKLYGRYQRRIAAYVYGMVNDYGRAEDITQEVFISALRRMRETDRPIAFKPWIYEIAKNACIDQFRRSRRAEEVSFDADDALGAADTARLASPGATPDAAVAAKQQLDDLCGAFGGLSETHHQILVLRELEGLSYREIGERMGLSRPSVESTLFRARRRLSEEYDELVSGQRCTRIQTIIAGCGDSALGSRDQRRLARHVAHCQPCRREARLAGLDALTRERRSVRQAVAARVAALFPFPALFRTRKGGEDVVGGHTPNFVAQWSGTLTTVAEPMVAGWTKAAAAAATILVAGAGAGAVSNVGSQSVRGASGAASSSDLGARPASGIAGRERTSAAPSRGAAGNAAGTGADAGRPVGSRGGGGASNAEAKPPSAGAGGSGPGVIGQGPPAAPTDGGGLRNRVPSNPGSDPDPRGDDGQTGDPGVVRLPADVVAEAESKATTIDPAAGQAVGTVGDIIAP